MEKKIKIKNKHNLLLDIYSSYHILFLMKMVVNDNEGKQKNKISVGLIISKDDFNSTIFPEEVKSEIIGTPYYLLIFISREDSIKISCFPTETKNIKKILIKLIEFSPDLVKGISTVLGELNLSRDILHTTGICYELEKCFYETYLLGESLNAGDITNEVIKESFLAIDKVVNVEIEDISIHNE
ncbi:MAG: hypothetical protein CEE42_06815 [Promethearchaeota archaeon Loki_b31]|nr:MAG: hypothetical protein CEE42_06815 [Candidatus Lokiarchaeota archaeon Loki_b31]